MAPAVAVALSLGMLLAACSPAPSRPRGPAPAPQPIAARPAATDGLPQNALDAALFSWRMCLASRAGDAAARGLSGEPDVNVPRDAANGCEISMEAVLDAAGHDIELRGQRMTPADVTTLRSQLVMEGRAFACEQARMVALAPRGC